MLSGLPPGPLHGHYYCRNQLYTVHSGSPAILTDTPSPLEAPVIDTNTRRPRFRELRHLSHNFLYLLFVPKHHAWRDPLFQCLNYTRTSLPIEQYGDRFRLDPVLSREWMDLEIAIRTVAGAMFSLAPQRWLRKLINPWLFPARFRFLRTYPTDEAARAAAWYSIDNFLPLVGYASMALWLMHFAEVEMDWRDKVGAAKVPSVDAQFLGRLERAISWDEERVGGLYCIQTIEDVHPDERAQRDEVQWLLSSILVSGFPIPIYICWGNRLQRALLLRDAPGISTAAVPPEKDLEEFASGGGNMKFSRWEVYNGCWHPHPLAAPRASESGQSSHAIPAAPSPPLPKDTQQPPNETIEAFFTATESGQSSHAIPAAPFPPLPKDTQQLPNETIEAFFIRRRESNDRRMANENPTQRQRRISLAEHAKSGAVPKKAYVFVWENQNGHWIRHMQIRGEFPDLWSEYPGPERRFDPFRNEWDLCTLFRNNDPVFGQGFDSEPDDSDSDMDYDPPTFAQNIDMNSQLAREREILPEMVGEPHPMEILQDPQLGYPLDEDDDFYDPSQDDFTESSVPQCDVAEASRRCLDAIFEKFHRASTTETPKYELVAENLLDTLKRRFGFVMPPSPETFVPANPPHEKFDLQHLADIVGMTEYDVSAELASHKGLRTILGTFFGQCLECRTQLSIDKRLLDIWTEGSWPASPFEISREYLTSRQNPAERCYYYVLRRRGSGIGSEVLLMPRATDFLEILRQQWGPDIRDVVRHLLGRGIRFWLALMSAEIKEKSKPAPAGLRPKGYKTDTSTGLGFRPQGYTFGARDYKGYIIERDLRLLHTPRARIALQYGGLIARLARSEVHDEDFFRGFDDDIYDIGDCLWDGTSPYAYWYDRLSDNEVDVLCGVYHVGTGEKQGKKNISSENRGPDTAGQIPTDDQTSIVSWWPRLNMWERGTLHRAAWWTPQCEDDFFAKYLGFAAKGFYKPQSPTKWRSNIRFKKQARELWDRYEHVADLTVQVLLKKDDSTSL